MRSIANTCPSASTRKTVGGFSLIELMVSLAIGLIVTLAITGVLVRSEGSKRTSTSVNDINQTGAYVSYTLDRALRSAGSGFVQNWTQAVGCELQVSRGGVTILPAAAGTKLKAPFEEVPASFRLAPVVIKRATAEGASDLITVMAGNAGFGEIPFRMLTGSVTATTVGLPNTLTFRPGDLVLLVEDGIGCMVQQVAAGFAGIPAMTGAVTPVANTQPPNQALTLGGLYATSATTKVNILDFGKSGNAFVSAIGNVASPSQFQVFGVGANNTLFNYDVLRLDGTDDPVPIADGVVEMRALYGVAKADGTFDTWIAPDAVGFTAEALTDGSAAAQTNLRRIISIRVGLVMRTSLLERENVSPESVSLFADLGGTLKTTHDIPEADRKYRYRTVEFTVPLRNMRYTR